MDKWIRKNLDHIPNGRGLTENIIDLSGVENCSDSFCLNIDDMDLIQEKELHVTGAVEEDPDDEDDTDEEYE